MNLENYDPLSRKIVQSLHGSNLGRTNILDLIQRDLKDIHFQLETRAPKVALGEMNYLCSLQSTLS